MDKLQPVAWVSRLPEGDVYNCAWAEKQNDDDVEMFMMKNIRNAQGSDIFILNDIITPKI